jgi:predicted AAA+ superfamily ATPase
MSKGFSSPKLTLHIGDGFKFIKEHKHEFDVIITDSSDPEGFLDDLGDSGAFIDEVQRAPDLLLAIKAVVDREQRPGRYLLSGSNQPRVASAVSDSLLGRVANRTLRPFTLSELRYDEHHPGWSFLFDDDENSVLAELERRATSSGTLDWRETVRTGGFPRVVKAPPADRARLLNDYITIFSSQDIRDLIAIESGVRFESFLRLMGARSGQELNASRISGDLGIPVSTIRRWIGALQRTFILELVTPWSRNASERVIKSPKAYLVDSALALTAARERMPTGFHFETLVANDLQVWRDEEPGRGLFHWRASQQEVDFVLQQDANLLPIEIKTSQEARRADARHLRAFREGNNNSPRGLLLSCDSEIRVIDVGIIAAPFWAVM